MACKVIQLELKGKKVIPNPSSDIRIELQEKNKNVADRSRLKHKYTTTLCIIQRLMDIPEN
jgi:hypothetical protein